LTIENLLNSTEIEAVRVAEETMGSLEKAVFVGIHHIYVS
jgi:hypothetical protein